MKEEISKDKNNVKNGKKRSKLSLALIILVFVIGLLVLLYPIISRLYYRVESGYQVDDFDKGVQKLSNDEIIRRMTLARAFNASLVNNIEKDPYTEEQKAAGRAEYARMLEINEKIGHVEIPSIDQDLPIYAGTTEDVLQKGVGHLEGTSLPIGGTDTHAVLTAHRGLPTNKLFTDLDKLKEGDVFYIHNLSETLAYKVDQIKVVEPSRFEDLLVVKGKDYATLLTCTPYMINTHRLLVRGVRIPYEAAESVVINREEKIFLRYKKLFYISLGVILLLIIMIVTTRHRRNRYARAIKKLSAGIGGMTPPDGPNPPSGPKGSGGPPDDDSPGGSSDGRNGSQTGDEKEASEAKDTAMEGKYIFEEHVDLQEDFNNKAEEIKIKEFPGEDAIGGLLKENKDQKKVDTPIDTENNGEGEEDVKFFNKIKKVLIEPDEDDYDEYDEEAENSEVIEKESSSAEKKAEAEVTREESAEESTVHEENSGEKKKDAFVQPELTEKEKKSDSFFKRFSKKKANMSIFSDEDMNVDEKKRREEAKRMAEEAKARLEKDKNKLQELARQNGVDSDAVKSNPVPEANENFSVRVSSIDNMDEDDLVREYKRIRESQERENEIERQKNRERVKSVKEEIREEINSEETINTEDIKDDVRRKLELERTRNTESNKRESLESTGTVKNARVREEKPTKITQMHDAHEELVDSRKKEDVKTERKKTTEQIVDTKTPKVGREESFSLNFGADAKARHEVVINEPVSKTREVRTTHGESICVERKTERKRADTEERTAGEYIPERAKKAKYSLKPASEVRTERMSESRVNQKKVVVEETPAQRQARLAAEDFDRMMAERRKKPTRDVKIEDVKLKQEADRLNRLRDIFKDE